MKDKLELDELGLRLQAARPLLVTRVTPGELMPDGGQAFQLEPGILDHPLEWTNSTARVNTPPAVLVRLITASSVSATNGSISVRLKSRARSY